ncbi:hypothetical protein KEM56_000166, partial [Ascosphaera pollenicola]
MEMAFPPFNFRWPTILELEAPGQTVTGSRSPQAARVSRLLAPGPLPGSFARHSSFSLASPAAAPLPRRSSTTTTATTATTAATTTTSPSSTSTSTSSSSSSSSGGTVDSRNGDGRTLPLIITSWKTSPVTPPIEHKDHAPWGLGFASKQETVDPYAAVPDPPTPKSPSSPSSPCMDDSTRHAEAESCPRTDHETSESESVPSEQLAADFASLKIETPICSSVEGQSPLLSGISVA